MPYTWGTIGLTFNREQIERRLADAPLDSLDLLFKPELAARFADCGISLIDSPDEVLALALHYLGRDPRSGKPQDLAAALALLQRIKPYIRKFQSQPVAQLVNEEICLSLGYSGDAIRPSAPPTKPARHCASSTGCRAKARLCGWTAWRFRSTRSTRNMPMR